MDAQPLGKLAANLQLNRPMTRKRLRALDPPAPPEPPQPPTKTVALREQIAFRHGFFMSDNAIDTELAPQLTPYEYAIYRRLWFESFGGAGGLYPRRNYCQVGYDFLLRGSACKSRKAVITAVKGLLEKKCILRLDEDQVSPQGSTYRVLRPEEIRKGELEEGILFQDLDGHILRGSFAEDFDDFPQQDNESKELGVSQNSTSPKFLSVKPSQPTVPQENSKQPRYTPTAYTATKGIGGKNIASAEKTPGYSPTKEKNRASQNTELTHECPWLPDRDAQEKNLRSNTEKKDHEITTVFSKVFPEFSRELNELPEYAYSLQAVEHSHGAKPVEHFLSECLTCGLLDLSGLPKARKSFDHALRLFLGREDESHSGEARGGTSESDGLATLRKQVKDRLLRQKPEAAHWSSRVLQMTIDGQVRRELAKREEAVE